MVTACGLVWKAGPLFVKFMVDPNQHMPKYLWLRMVAMVLSIHTRLSTVDTTGCMRMAGSLVGAMPACATDWCGSLSSPGCNAGGQWQASWA